MLVGGTVADELKKEYVFMHYVFCATQQDRNFFDHMIEFGFLPSERATFLQYRAECEERYAREAYPFFFGEMSAALAMLQTDLTNLPHA